MKNNKIQNFLKVLVLIFIANCANALDLSVSNFQINPGTTINGGTSYSLLIDIANIDDLSGVTTSSGQRIIINMDGSTPSNIIEQSTLNSVTGGDWTDESTVSGEIVVESASVLNVAGSKSVQINLTAGSASLGPEAITVRVEDFVETDTNALNDTSAINVTILGTEPDLDFNDSVTLTTYNAVENQTTPVSIDFKVDNLGGDATSGVGITIIYDDINLIFEQGSSVIPSGWSCFPSTGILDCSTFNPVASGSATSFTLDFLVSSVGTYNLNATLTDFGGIETNTSNNTISTSIDVVAGNYDLTLTRIDPASVPLSIPLGTTASTPLVYEVRNSGNATFTTDVEIFLAFDPAFSVSNTSVQPAQIAGIWDCVPQTGGILCTLLDDSINPGDVLTLTADISSYPSTSGVYGNSINIQVTDLSGREVSLSDNMDAFDIEMTELQTDIRLTKYVKDLGGTLITDVDVGVDFAYHIHVDNLSLTSATNVIVTDPLPVGVQFVGDISSGNWSCIADPFIDQNNSQGVQCSHPSIPASSPNFADVIKLQVVGLTTGLKENTAVAASDELDSNPFDNDNISSPATVNINQPVADPDITVVKTIQSGVTGGAGSFVAIQGDTVVYKILGKNLSSTSAPGSNVRITDVLPAGVTYVSHSALGPNFICDPFDSVNNKVTCTATSLPFTTAEDGLEITVQVTGSVGTFVINTANITADADADPGNNTSVSDSFEIVAAPMGEISIDKTVAGGIAAGSGSGATNEFAVGDTVFYQISASNNSAAINYDDLVIKDTLPVNVAFDSFTTTMGFNCNYDAVNHEVSCQNDANNILGPGQTVTVDINAIASVSGLGIQNTASASSNTNGDNISSAPAIIDIVNPTVNPTVLTITKQALLDNVPIAQISRGSSFVYRIDVINAGTENAQGLHLSDLMPDSLSVDSIATQEWNCSNSALQYDCVFIGDLSPGTSSSIEFFVTNDANSTNLQLINVATVSADNAVAQTAQNTLFITDTSATLTVTQNPNPVDEGGLFDLQLTLTNTGTEDILNPVLVNTLPAGFTYTTLPTTPNCTSSGLAMTCLFDSALSVGSSEMITAQVQAISPAVIGTDYINNAVLTGTNLLQPVLNNSILNVNQINTQVHDVSIAKTASATSMLPSSEFQYVLTVSNLGTAEANAIVVTDSLPQGITLKSIDAAGWSCSGLVQVTCSLATLSPSSASQIILNVSAPAELGLIQNTADVSMLDTDQNSANNTSQVSVDITNSPVTPPVDPPIGNAVADLQVTKSTDNDVTSGGEFDWSIEVLNNGPDAAQNVVVNDTLPSGFEFISAQSDSGTCQFADNAVVCSISNINNQQSVAITVHGKANVASGALANSVSVESETTDDDLTNNTSEASITVNPVPVNSADLSVSIDAEPNIAQGSWMEMTVDVKNHGGASADSPDLSLSFTGFIDQIVPTSVTGWSCSENNLDMNCSFSQSQMSSGYQQTLTFRVKTSENVNEPENIQITAQITSSTADPDNSNNSASSGINVTSETPTEQEIENAMRNALAGRGNEQIFRAIQNVASYCERSYFTALEGMCERLYETALSGDGETIERVMSQITPNEIINQSTSVTEIAQAQFRNVGNRLAQIRNGGGRGFNSSGLVARYGNGSLPINTLAYLNQSEEELKEVNNVNNDFISPWGFFINGSISMGERDATGRELGFDFDTYGLTAGLDYRVNSNSVVGLALGYASFDSKIEDEAKLKSTGMTLTAYGSFNVNDNFYVDARISMAKPEFEQTREIDFTLGDVQVQRTASGSTDGKQYTVAMSAGYNFNKNSWNITPNASIQYVRTKIDGFVETGAGAFNFVYSNQEIESLVWSAGMRVSKAISLKNGVITPQFDFDYNYESMNDAEDIEARFILAPTDEIFIIETDSPDRTYGSAGLGFVYVSSNGKQAYLNYRSILGLEGFSRGTFNLGARFEF
ncbi:MAG: autotransporter domain-containing protein [Gammaproteobacteria bacterium]